MGVDGAISRNAQLCRLAISMGVVALIMSMPRGGLLFNYWPLVVPGRPGHVVHRSWGIIREKGDGLTDGKRRPGDIAGAYRPYREGVLTPIGVKVQG